MTDLWTPAAAVRRMAAEAPGGIAVVGADGLAWSWAWLDARAEAIAVGLAARGVHPADHARTGGPDPAVTARIAAQVPATPDGLALLVAAERVGACLITLPERLAAAEIAEALDAIDPALFLDGEGARGTSIARLAGDLAEVDAPGAAHVAARSAVLGVLTSGTTGRPKVALLSRAAMLASARAWTAALPPATGWLLALGLAHVAGLGVAWRALGAGLPVVIAQPGDAVGILAALARAPFPSHLSLVPTQLARILDAGADEPPPDTLLAVPLGGAPIPAALVVRAAGCGWPVVPTYGLTEAGSGVTALPSAEAAAHPTSAGRPLPGVEVRISAADNHGVGEVEVRSPGCFSGYLGPDDRARSSFTTDGWLRTGDLGRLDEDGRLAVSDRRADLIISGGENVHPAHVEAVLESHPALAEVGVAGRPDAAWGAVPVAVVVIRPDMADPGDDALREFCRLRLATWKVPAIFIRAATLPRTPSGKLRRAELRALVAAVDPSTVRRLPPQTPTASPANHDAAPSTRPDATAAAESTSASATEAAQARSAHGPRATGRAFR